MPITWGTVTGSQYLAAAPYSTETVDRAGCICDIAIQARYRESQRQGVTVAGS